MTDGFATRAIHAGQTPDPVTGSIVPPIHQTSTFLQDGVGNLREGYEYGRSGNPTRTALEVQVAALELGAHASAFASGLAAEDALLRAVLAPGDRVVLGDDAYGGTHRLLARIHVPAGIVLDTVDLTDEAAVTEAFSTPVQLLWLETPTNPLMKIVDIEALAARAHAAGATVVVDNTFASPALQQPLTLGADVVVHSATKYLGGHSDVIGGVVVTSDDRIAEQVAFLQFAAGAVLAPMEAFLLTRGIKTLAVRMRQHSANATAIAEQLLAHPSIERVFYPGLPDHPGHEVAARQMRGFGGMVSVAVRGGRAEALRLAEGTRLFSLAESLGGVESLIGHPDSMTHASVRGTPLAVPENVVRFSVGIEELDDLQADIAEALDRI
ncbi:cystathionine gamma-synthase [Amnibacterium kyonggiense]|uniref:Cystathionine gamma-lyase n=1 Tax=Amnibacterium kyonggiense TaxID=595671 RepID=A0A4R7FJE5_9MICO|nr:cystathionine gamma-synthase [Amnibacterium kyonggiense]TDS76192.1 cystathionine gamma-lyase [Amnibacterium kyonggiense]